MQKGIISGKETRKAIKVHRWIEGDRVTPVVPTDHPEDAVGEVVMTTANGGAMVRFPVAGVEVYPPDELAPAPVEKGK
jgi:hypothetical protein